MPVQYLVSVLYLNVYVILRTGEDPFSPRLAFWHKCKAHRTGGWGAHFIHIESTILVPLPGSMGHIFHHVPEEAASISDT